MIKLFWRTSWKNSRNNTWINKGTIGEIPTWRNSCRHFPTTICAEISKGILGAIPKEINGEHFEETLGGIPERIFGGVSERIVGGITAEIPKENLERRPLKEFFLAVHTQIDCTV